ncbi:MAG TPA: hypothetical protein VGC73_13050 [Pyrinomonadaceae bacterium]|jgi:hypothetical protein
MKQLLSLAIIHVTVLAIVACNRFAPPTQRAGETGQISRKVNGQELVSTQQPAVRLKFDKAFKYAGTQSFVLYDVANAEQHFFVDADKEGRIKRLYWIQFEGYLPSNTHTYDYDSEKKVDIGGLNFFADAFARNVKLNPGRANSDGNRGRAFVQAKGFRMASDEIMMQRLVHLTDATNRNELMIIYAEDLSGTGMTAADLSKDGKDAARWDEISKGLLDRAVKGMTISK